MPQYYCHRCLRSFDIDASAEIACTRCHGEFVEQVNRPAMLAAAMPGGFQAVNHIVDIIRNRLTQGEAPQGAQQQEQGQQPPEQNEGEAPRAAAGGNAAQEPISLEQFIGSMFRQEPRANEGPQNLSFTFQMPGGVGVQIQAHRAGPAHPDGVPPFIANLNEDRVELENAVQEMMAQLTGDAASAPRGFSDSDIAKYLPMKKVTQEHIDNGAQCTTCFDTFKIGEDVGALDCSHIFHRPCIDPWLKTKNSCPVCRQKVSMSSWKKRHQKTVQEAVLDDLD